MEDTGKILLNSLKEHLDQTGLLPESQCEFGKDRGTTDIIFIALLLQEKCLQQNVDIMTFVSVTKAFDRVSRDGLRKVMATFGCPARFIAMIRKFLDGLLARVKNDDEYSEPFPETNGVKTRMCSGTYTVLHDVLSHAHRCFSGL